MYLMYNRNFNLTKKNLISEYLLSKDNPEIEPKIFQAGLPKIKRHNTIVLLPKICKLQKIINELNKGILLGDIMKFYSKSPINK